MIYSGDIMLDRCKKTVRSIREKSSPANVFVWMMALSFAFYAVFYAFYGRAAFVDVFFSRCGDLFMDFFNSVRDAAQGPAVYTERRVIYPPMANLIYLICSKFIPDTYNRSDWFNRHSWMQYPEAVFFICLFSLIFILVLYNLFHESVSGGRWTKFLFSFFAIFNIPVLYMIERGNIIIFCFISLLVYAMTYNSQNRVHRELGLIALAFAFSLKLYPVIFGWFLLVDKRFKDAVRCAIYGVAMLILPSFFFGGLSCFVQVYKNITSFSAAVGTVNSISVVAGYSGIPEAVWNMGAYAWCFICVLCFVLSPFIHRERWKCWMLGISFILTVPSLTAMYTWAFLLVPIIMFSNSDKFRRKDWFFFMIITILFMFTIFRFNYYLTINSLLLYPFTAILSITAVADTVITGVRRYRAGEKKVSEAE